MNRGKKYVEAAKAIDRATLYDTDEAVALVKKVAVAKFDETIEAHIRTGCDGRHADPILFCNMASPIHLLWLKERSKNLLHFA